jgi:polyisoprenoid-binding protein YceI
MSGWLVPALLAGLACATAAHATDYRFDPARSHAEFGVRLLWVHTISGRFGQIAGEVNLDSHGHATVDARITAQSLTMDSARVRHNVLAPEFFDAGRYPTIHFLSDPIPMERLARGGLLNGQLSLRGVTRAVHFELLPASCANITAQGCLIKARGVISRSAFGMTSHRAALSDEVQLGLLIALQPARR